MGKHHNDGQHDGAKGYGNANPQHSVVEEFFSLGDSNKEINEDNNDYWAGYNHALEQKED